MLIKNTEKNNEFTEFEKYITEILAIQNSKLKPFIEIFRYFPENISTQPLGILTGFFKISDISDNSAYIVNFLNSILKKEYYANPQRPVSQSFDSALHKVNIALSELAKHGNINWLGNLDAAICVLEKNNLHFSITGKAHVVLARNGKLTNISQDLNENIFEPNPLKTFTNVSSGKLENHDKLIISSDEFFQILPLTEIKKVVQRLIDKEKFSQFIKTAAINELDMTAVLIIDIKTQTKKMLEKKGEKISKKRIFNVFSEKSFQNVSEQKTFPLIKKNIDHDYIDEKTGHIYIQEQENFNNKDQSSVIYLLIFILKEKILNILFYLKIKIRKNVRFLTKKISNLCRTVFNFYKSNQSIKNSIQKKHFLCFKITSIFPCLFSFISQKSEKIKLIIMIFFERFFSKISIIYKKSVCLQNLNKKIFAFWLPNFKKISRIFKILPYDKKLYVLLLIITILILPFIYLKFQKNKLPTENLQVINDPVNPLKLILEDKNAQPLTESNTLFTSEEKELTKLLFLEKFLVIIANNQLLVWDNGKIKEYLWPETETKIKSASYMEDLNLLFLLTDKNKIFSFSPTNFSFKENKIQIPENASVNTIESYLTYLYLIDANNNRIYRYPRAEGGFGEKVNWLKEDISLDKYLHMAIDENIYLADDLNIIKLFQGKQKPFSLESVNISFRINKMLINKNLQNIYILDRENGRIIVFGKDGSLQNQYVSSDLYEARDFYVDEKNKSIYFITSHRFASFFLP